MNPHAAALQQRSEELVKLQKENDTLREKVKLLEEGRLTKEGGLPSKLSPEAGPSVESQVKGRRLPYKPGVLWIYNQEKGG